MNDPKQIVRAGYDRVSYAYRGDDASDEPYRTWLRLLDTCLPTGAAVLDLGCGCGIPAARLLAARYAVTGVDISPVQVARARAYVPSANFICADMTTLDFSPSSFAAVLCLYALIHVPLAEQPALFDGIARFLQPGGLLLATVGATAWTGCESDWLGVPGGTMYWSHADAATYQHWLQQRGFTLAYSEFIPEGDGGHVLVLAQRSADSSEV